MIEFVKYACGCIGTSPNLDGMAIVIDSCDSEDGGLSLSSHRRQMQEKSFFALTKEENDFVIDAIGTLVAYGYLWLSVVDGIKQTIRRDDSGPLRKYKETIKESMNERT